MGLQSIYALVDLVFIGKIGESAVAGLSISLQLFFVILALSRVLGTTALAQVSQLYGADDISKAHASMSAFLIAAFGLGLVSAVCAYLVVDRYIALFTDDPAVIEQGTIYLRISCLTFFTQIVAIVFGDGFRAAGDFRTPMRILASGVLLNILLDALLIFGFGPIPAMGIAGAAWATVASQVLVVVAYTITMFRPGGPRALRWRKPAWSRTFFVQLGTRGLPAGLQFFSLSILLGLVLAAMKPHGAEWTAAAGGGFRVLHQGILPMIAIAVAASAVAGQNYGAGQFSRVREATWTASRWNLGLGLVGSVLLFVGARTLGSIFASEAGLDTAQLYFQWTAPTMIAATTIIPTFVLQALSRPALPLIGTLIRIAVLGGLIFVVIPSLALSPEYVFAASSSAAFVECLISFVLLRFVLARLGPDSQPSAPRAGETSSERE